MNFNDYADLDAVGISTAIRRGEVSASLDNSQSQSKHSFFISSIIYLLRMDDQSTVASIIETEKRLV